MVLDLTFYCQCDASATGFSAFLGLPNDFLFECANKFFDNLIAASKGKMSKTQVYRLSKHCIDVYGELTEAQREKSSTLRELYGLLAMLLECFKLLRGTCFRVCLDNANSVLGLGGKAPQTAFKFYGCSCTPEIQALIISILELVSEGYMQMEAYWVPRELN
eukprot:2103197-Rhodomonas_salina.1